MLAPRVLSGRYDDDFDEAQADIEDDEQQDTSINQQGENSSFLPLMLLTQYHTMPYHTVPLTHHTQSSSMNMTTEKTKSLSSR